MLYLSYTISQDGYCDRVVRTDEATFILTSNLGAEVTKHTHPPLSPFQKAFRLTRKHLSDDSTDVRCSCVCCLSPLAVHYRLVLSAGVVVAIVAIAAGG